MTTIQAARFLNSRGLNSYVLDGILFAHKEETIEGKQVVHCCELQPDMQSILQFLGINQD